MEKDKLNEPELNPDKQITQPINNNEDGLRTAIRLLEQANNMQDKKIKILEAEIKEPKIFAAVINKYKWLLSFIFVSLVLIIVHLIIHSWYAYKEYNDNRFAMLKENVGIQIQSLKDQQEIRSKQ
ncbi:MAG: hypothetical protein LBD17_04215 [Endomicrobium sp.]|jgi:hypothetical protein|nr:hypothetical protein [Endomicrobium sp.]